MDAEAAARLHKVELQVAAFTKALAQFPELMERLNKLHDDFLRREGAAEARAHLDRQLVEMPSRMAEHERRLEALEAHHAAGTTPVIVHDDAPTESVWRDESVRAWATRIVAMLCAAGVVIAGIMAGIVTTLPEGVLAGLGS